MKKVLMLALAVIMMLSVFGCAQQPATEPSEPSEPADTSAPADTTEPGDATEEVKELNITYLSPSTESEYWQYNEIGMRNALIDVEEKYGVKINFTVAGPATEAETDAYIKAFESVIASGPDIILTATLAPDGTVAKAQEAQNMGIYVNFIGMGLEGGDSNEYGDYYGVHYYCDNWGIGEAAAQCMIDKLNAEGRPLKGTVGIHMSVIVETLEERMDGFKAYMAEHAPEIVCLDTLYNENDVNKAQANVETQISTYGEDLIGLYGANNISGDGIALALKGANLGGQIVGIGVDSDSLEIEALQEGNLYAIIAQTPYEQGYRGLENAVEYVLTGVNNETEKHVVCPATAVTKELMDSDPQYAALLDPTLLKVN